MRFKRIKATVTATFKASAQKTTTSNDHLSARLVKKVDDQYVDASSFTFDDTAYALVYHSSRVVVAKAVCSGVQQPVLVQDNYLESVHESLSFTNVDDSVEGENFNDVTASKPIHTVESMAFLSGELAGLSLQDDGMTFRTTQLGLAVLELKYKTRASVYRIPTPEKPLVSDQDVPIIATFLGDIK